MTGDDALVRVVEAAPSGATAIVRDERLNPRTLPTGRELASLWQTDRLLETLDGAADGHGLFPSVNGARLWQLRIPPDDPAAPTDFHATPTIDLGFVLRGRVTLEIRDGGSVELVSGEAFVQRGVAHRWLNAGPETAVLGVVVIGTGG